MITNEYLDKLYKYRDRDAILCQVLDYARNKNECFFNNINNSCDIEQLTEEEKYFIICIAVLVKYKSEMLYPAWLDDDRLKYQEPVFFNKRHITEEQKQDLLLNGHKVFKQHNLYFLEEGLERI